MIAKIDLDSVNVLLSAFIVKVEPLLLHTQTQALTDKPALLCRVSIVFAIHKYTLIWVCLHMCIYLFPYICSMCSYDC